MRTGDESSGGDEEGNGVGRREEGVGGFDLWEKGKEWESG